MSTKNFLQEIEKGLTAPAYLLYSDDQYLIEDAITSIKKLIPETEMDFNFNVFDLDYMDGNQTSEQIIVTLNTIPFWGKQRYVIVKNLQKISGKDLKTLHAYIANPSPYAVLIISHTGAIKKELRENIKGMKTFCLDIREKDIPAWIKEKVRQKGLTINDDAVRYLMEIVGADIGLLSSEVEKLVLAGSKGIGINNIREIVEGNMDYNVFDLTKALREKNAEQVFKIFRALSGTSEPYNLLGAINWQYSRMLMQTDSKNSQTEISNKKDYSNLVFKLLNEADIQIKSSGGAYPIEYLLVRLLQL